MTASSGPAMEVPARRRAVTRPVPPLPGRWLAGALVTLVAGVALAIVVGPAALPLRDVVGALVDALPGVAADHGLDERAHAVLWQIRLPRIVLAGMVGGTLACAGAAYQGVFRNPLADPYLLGVASGAGLGATLTLAAGVRPLGGASLPLLAFAGAVLAVGVTWMLGLSAGMHAAESIVLAGIAVASFLSAAQTFVMQRDAESIRDVYAFLLGALGTTGWADVRLVLPWVVVAVVGLLASRRRLDVLAVGDSEADSLGLSSARVRLVVVALATLGTAAVVAVSGLIGFVGIVVPHTIRLLVGTSYRALVPLSLVGGAAFLIVCDVVARTALSPAEVPIGVVTAFVGGPFFVVVLRTSRRVSS